MKSILATVLSIFAVAAPCVASDASPETARAIRGRVVKVADGDTATILDASNRQHKIRFHGIK